MKKAILFLSLNLCSLCTIIGQKSYEEAMLECRNLGYIESQQCMIGKEIPEFEGTTYTGRVINKDSIKNKVTVINFWFMGCAPCLAELDGLNEVVEIYKDREDVEFISFTRDDLKLLEDDFFPNHTFEFEIIPKSEAIIEEVFKHRWGYPTTIVVDKSSKIHLITTGGSTEPDAASKEIKKTLVTSMEECLKK